MQVKRFEKAQCRCCCKEAPALQEHPPPPKLLLELWGHPNHTPSKRTSSVQTCLTAECVLLPAEVRERAGL